MTTWPDIMKAWNKLKTRLRLQMPSLQYVTAKEEGPKTGMKHLHVVLFSWQYVPQAQLSEWWQSYTGAWSVGIQRVDGEHAARYVAKHFGKVNPLTRRVVSFSKHWPKLSCPDYHFEAEPAYDVPLNVYCLATSPDGWKLEFLTPGCHCFDHITWHFRPDIAQEINERKVSPHDSP